MGVFGALILLQCLTLSFSLLLSAMQNLFYYCPCIIYYPGMCRLTLSQGCPGTLLLLPKLIFGSPTPVYFILLWCPVPHIVAIWSVLNSAFHLNSSVQLRWSSWAIALYTLVKKLSSGRKLMQSWVLPSQFPIFQGSLPGTIVHSYL